MHECVGIAQGQGQTQANDETHPNADDANNGEVEPHFQRVKPAQHEDGVDEHDEVATSHEEAIKQDGIRTNIAKTPATIHIDLNSREGGIESDLDKLRLPCQGEGISMLQLHPATLAGHLLNNIRERHIPVELGCLGSNHMTGGIVHLLTQQICEKRT